MSSSVRIMAIGDIRAFWRSPARNSLSCCSDVACVLAREVRPFGIGAVAVRAVAGHARDRFGLAGFLGTGGERRGAPAEGGHQKTGWRRASQSLNHSEEQGRASGKLYTKRPGVSAAPRVQMPAYPNVRVPHQRQRGEAASARRRGRGRRGRPIQCRQVECDQRHHASQGTGADQQDARRHPTHQLLRDSNADRGWWTCPATASRPCSGPMRQHWGTLIDGYFRKRSSPARRDRRDGHPPPAQGPGLGHAAPRAGRGRSRCTSSSPRRTSSGAVPGPQVAQPCAARRARTSRCRRSRRCPAKGCPRRGARSSGCCAGTRKKKPRLDQRIQPGKANPALGDDRADAGPGR